MYAYIYTHICVYTHTYMHVCMLCVYTPMYGMYVGGLWRTEVNVPMPSLFPTLYIVVGSPLKPRACQFS